MTYQRKIRTIQHLAILGFLLMTPFLSNLGGVCPTVPDLTFGLDHVLALVGPLTKPSYTIRGLHEFSLEQLLEAIFQEYKREETDEKPCLTQLDPYIIGPHLTLAQILPLLRVFSEPQQGFTEIIQAVSSAIMLIGSLDKACCQFYIMGIQFYLLKIGGRYLVLSPRPPLAWPWFPAQLTWLMQQLLCSLYSPRDLQLIWWWFGEPRQFIQPPTWKESRFIDWGERSYLVYWSLEKQLAPFIIAQLLELSKGEQEQAHAFLQEILNLYLGVAPGSLSPANSLQPSIILSNGQLLYWQGYAGLVTPSLEKPEQILSQFQQLIIGEMVEIPIFTRRSVVSWTKRPRHYPNQGKAKGLHY